MFARKKLVLCGLISVTVVTAFVVVANRKALLERYYLHRLETVSAEDRWHVASRLEGLGSTKVEDWYLSMLEADAWENRTRAAERLAENDIATEYSPAERDDIAERVAIAAVKFGELQNHRTSDYNLDLDRFTQFTGKTGPYLLYAVVRVGSLLRRATQQDLVTGPLLEPAVDVERNLMLQLTRLPDVVDRAAELRAPNHIAEYAYEVAADLSRFYEQCHVLTEEDTARQASWLTLVDLTGAVLGTCLDLLAIPVPERM